MMRLQPRVPVSYTSVSTDSQPGSLPAVRETPREPQQPRLLDRVREAISTRHYSRRTEKAYVHWIKRYIFFHGKRHPAEMGAPEVTAFLTSLAVHDKVAASTQNQALSALLFLYREVLGVELPWLDDVVRAKRPQHLPVVLTREEVRTVLQRLDGVPRLMALLLYGAGLRLLECCRLRVKDVDFATNQIVIRERARATPSRPPPRRRLGRAARRAPAQVPERRPRLGLAMGVPGHAHLCGTRHRPATPPSPPRIRAPAGGAGCRPRRQDRQAGDVPHVPSLVCHAPSGGEPRHPHRPGTPQPPGREHDDDLHPGPQPGPSRGPEPSRPDVPVMSLGLHQRYQISERDIPQLLAVYHGTRDGAPAQDGGNSDIPRRRQTGSL